MSDGLKARHRAAIIATLAANDRVERAVLFGSRAMGTNTITSDVDIALFGQQLTLTDQASLAAACEELPMAQSVDLVLHSAIDNPALVEHIRSYGVEWYQRGGGDGAKVAKSDGNAPTRQKINEVPVSEVATVVIGGTPSREINEYWNGTIPWATAKDIANAGSRHLHNTQDFITDIGLANSSTKIMPKDTVIITSRGTVGALVQLGKEMAFNQTCYAVLPGTGIDNDFLYYALIGTRHSLKSLTYGTVFQTITTKSFDSWRIPLPPLKQQKAIAHILGTLDDKIELNRRMNETLEAMARALFKDWFVDFGPVRAKAEGREAYLPEEIWGLFPDSFEDSELGEIPRGWGVCSLNEIMKITMGQSPPGSTYNEIGEGLPFYQGRSDFQFRHPRERVFCSEPSRVAPPMATLMSVRAPVGSINMADRTCCIGRGVAALQSINGLNSYTYYLMDSLQDIFKSYNSEGTVFGAINKKDLTDFKMLNCGSVIAKVFNNTVYQIDEKISFSISENNTLTSLRDTLLPKLISGEIRIYNVNHFLRRIIS